MLVTTFGSSGGATVDGSGGTPGIGVVVATIVELGDGVGPVANTVGVTVAGAPLAVGVGCGAVAGTQSMCSPLVSRVSAPSRLFTPTPVRFACFGSPFAGFAA